MDLQTLFSIGITLIFIGILVILVAIMLLFLSTAKKEGKIKGGGAIIIGPIPIIFGTNKESIKTILLLALALTVALVILMVVLHLVSG